MVVDGSILDRVTFRVGFREDFRVNDMVGVVRVAPGAGGALGVDFGYGGWGGWGSFGRVN